MGAIFKLAEFLAHPGRLGKAEIGETVNTLLVLLDGVCLPPNNWVLAGYRAMRKELAHPDKTNQAVLELIGSALGAQGRNIPGVERTVEKSLEDPNDWRIRDNLGGDFAKWAEFLARRHTEGLTVELAMTTDPNKCPEWSELLHSRTVKRM